MSTHLTTLFVHLILVVRRTKHRMEHRFKMKKKVVIKVFLMLFTEGGMPGQSDVCNRECGLRGTAMSRSEGRL